MSWLSLQLRLWKVSKVFSLGIKLCSYAYAYFKYYCKFIVHSFNLKVTRIFTLVVGQPLVFSNYKNIGHFLTRNVVVLSVVYWIHKIIINLFLKTEDYQNIWNYILPPVMRNNDWLTVSSLWENYFYQYTYKEEIFAEDFESFANEEVLKIYEVYDKNHDHYKRMKEHQEAKYPKAYILGKRIQKTSKLYGQDLFKNVLNFVGIKAADESLLVKVGGMLIEYPLRFIRYLESEVSKTLRKIIRKVAPEHFRDPHFKKLTPEEQKKQEHLPRLKDYLSFLMTPIRAVNGKDEELVSQDCLDELSKEYFKILLSKRGRLTNIYSFMQAPFNISDKNCFSFLIRLNYYGMRDDLLGYILVIYLYGLLYIIFKSLRGYLKQSFVPMLVAFYFEYFKMSKSMTIQIDELYEQFWPSYLKLKYEKISGLRQEIEPYKLVYFSSMQSDTWGFEYQYLLELMEGIWHSPYDNPLYMVPLVDQQIEAVSGWFNKFNMDHKTLDFQLKQGVSKELVPMRIRYALKYISFSELLAKREFERKYMIDRGILHGIHTFKSLIYKEVGMLAKWFKK